jgi:hypothetical protein
MTEQPEPYEVAIRCDRCLRRYGHDGARLLAVAELKPGEDWGVWEALRGGRGARPVAVREGGAPHGKVQYIAAPGPGAGYSRARRLVVDPITAAAAQLECPRKTCTHRPRESRARLVALAEQAMAAGRHDAYA